MQILDREGDRSCRLITPFAGWGIGRRPSPAPGLDHREAERAASRFARGLYAVYWLPVEIAHLASVRLDAHATDGKAQAAIHHVEHAGEAATPGV